MMAKEYFEKNKFAYLSGVLPEEECQKLTDHMLTLLGQGKLVMDEQCPNSWSIYGDEKMDTILANLAPLLSATLGIELIPTYTYCRVYKTGEVLKKHVDREACEISGTMTLGVSPNSEIWPIHFAEPNDPVGKSVQIEVGDLVMYRGNELVHWREQYKGDWQVQVFFHYVDANGPNKKFAFDCRPSLNTQKTQTPTPKLIEKMNKEVQCNAIYNGVMFPSDDTDCPGAATYNSKFNPQLAFTSYECLEIVRYAKALYPEKALVGTEDSGKFAPEIRRVEQYKIPLKNETKWIFDKITNAIGTANREYYKYDIMGITHELQLLHYKSDESGFYDWHTDVGPGHAATRKISASVMLSSENEYEGGDLIIDNYGNKVVASKEIGSVNMFPSFLPHTVTPVTKGDRWVLVIWVHGRNRFK